MRILNFLQLKAVDFIALNPVKAVLYEVARIAIVHGLRAITKSSKNKLDDKMIKPVIKSLQKK